MKQLFAAFFQGRLNVCRRTELRHVIVNPQSSDYPFKVEAHDPHDVDVEFFF